MGAASSAGFDCYCEESAFYAKYTQGKMLGKGSQGRVHVCVDRQTGQMRAVKIIDRSSRTAWATYRREVDLCRAVNNTHVISVLEEFVDSGCCYVVMEKFEGHLRKGLKWVAKESGGPKTPLSEDSLRRVVRQTLVAINHLHSCAIIHRDVKSHNLLIDRLDLRDSDCRVVLGDFGLARRLEHGRFLCSQVGTRKYWAPELYERKYWHNVDVFAVGVLIFLATTSSYPYMDEEQTRQRDIWRDGAVPSSLSAEAEDLLRLLLQKDPTKRPSASQVLEHVWLGGSGCAPVSAQAAPSLLADADKPVVQLAESPESRFIGPKLSSPRGAGPQAPGNLRLFNDEGVVRTLSQASLWSQEGTSLMEDSVGTQLAIGGADRAATLKSFAYDATPSTQDPWSSPQARLSELDDLASPVAPWRMAPDEEVPADKITWQPGLLNCAPLELPPL